MDERLHIAICENEFVDADHLVRYIEKEAINSTISVFNQGKAFLKNCTKGRYHIVFLDIYLDDTNGIDIAKALRKYDDNILIVFTTTSKEHALEASRFRAIQYITKPVAQESVVFCLRLAEALVEKQRKQMISVKEEGRAHREVAHDDIVFVKAQGQRCHLYTTTSDTPIVTTTTTSIDRLSKLLPEPRFLRCHRSYIVNFEHVKEFNGSDFVMSNNQCAYIRVRDRAKIKRKFDAYLMQYARETNNVPDISAK